MFLYKKLAQHCKSTILQFKKRKKMTLKHLNNFLKRNHTRICITESLCCTPETNTALLINYRSIKYKVRNNKGETQIIR